MAEPTYFKPSFFKFLRDLRENNNREWFQANKNRYEDHVKDPSLRFISDFGPILAKISKHFRADPRPVGGSMFRIYRDVRFSKNKEPYKTAVGIQFRHELGKSAHAPGFYLHLSPGEIFAAGGIWRPDGPTLKAIREGLVEDSTAWKRVKASKAFKTGGYELGGDSLKRPPKGFDPEHPLVEDLRRKDFIAHAKLTQKAVTDSGFPKRLASEFRQTAPLVRFLCKATDVAY